MQIISANKFKENCLGLLDDLTPEGLIITKHGKPVARLVPVGQEGAELIGSLRGKIEIRDGLGPTDVAWDAAFPLA